MKTAIGSGVGWVFGCLLALSVAGCGSDNLKPELPLLSWELRPGRLWTYGPYLLAPDTVAIGVPFAVEVITTIGGCSRSGPTNVSQLSVGVQQVSPMDSIFTGSAMCSCDIRPAHHRVMLVFTSPGEGIILVRGRAGVESDPDSLITVGKSVVIR